MKYLPLDLDFIIEELEAIYKVHGDIPVLFSSDDEGNSRSFIRHLPSVCTVKKPFYHGDRFWDGKGVSFLADRKTYKPLKTRTYAVLIN